MLSLPFDLLSTVCGAFSLLLDSARFLLGNVSPSLALTAGGLFIALSIADVGSQRTAGGAAAPGIGGRGYALIVVLVLFAMWFMLAGMLVRHPPIAWDDLRRVYYCLPTTTVLAFLVPGLVAPHFHRWTAGFGQRRVSLGVSVILLLILGSLVALPQHKNVIWHGFAKRHHDHTPVLLEALTQLHDPTYVPAHQVTTDPLYRLIRETAARKK
jgi:hypothetical protein